MSITDKTLRDKLLKEKDLDAPRIAERIQRNAYNRKNNIKGALISNREKDVKEQRIHKITYTGKYGTRSKD